MIINKSYSDFLRIFLTTDSKQFRIYTMNNFTRKISLPKKTHYLEYREKIFFFKLKEQADKIGPIVH